MRYNCHIVYLTLYHFCGCFIPIVNRYVKQTNAVFTCALRHVACEVHLMHIKIEITVPHQLYNIFIVHINVRRSSTYHRTHLFVYKFSLRYLHWPQLQHRSTSIPCWCYNHMWYLMFARVPAWSPVARSSSHSSLVWWSDVCACASLIPCLMFFITVLSPLWLDEIQHFFCQQPAPSSCLTYHCLSCYTTLVHQLIILCFHFMHSCLLVHELDNYNNYLCFIYTS